MPELDENNKQENNAIVTPLTIATFSAFFLTLKQIHVRLIAEGYVIKDGQITKSDRLLRYEQDSKPNRKNR